MRHLLALSLISLCGANAVPTDSQAILPAQQPVRLWDSVADKNFYLLALFRHNSAVCEVITYDGGLAKIFKAKLDAAGALYDPKKPAPVTGEKSISAALRFSTDEVDAVATRLRALFGESSALRELVASDLRRSGMYQRFTTLGDEELLIASWRQCADGINHTLDLYADGKPPRYPKIDSVSYDVTSPLYAKLGQAVLAQVRDNATRRPLFFGPSLDAAVMLMDANCRDEAGRFEPMESGENKAAFERIKHTDWSKYSYTAVVLPGHGFDEQTLPLAPLDWVVIRTGAERYHAGQAPFLIVSGGYVHPNQTRDCEALLMKQVLMTRFNVPADAILIDPHARHTTTNLRNASRLIYRYGMPFEKPALVCSEPYQTNTIASEAFRKRCVKELGYEPIKLGRRLSETDLEFLPQLDSLHADPVEPLDP